MLDADADELSPALTDRMRMALDDAIATLNIVQNGILTRPPLCACNLKALLIRFLDC